MIDALHEANGGSSTISAPIENSRYFDWPRPGKAMARRVWEQVREDYDVVRAELFHHFGDLMIRAHLTGFTWVERQSETGVITLSGERDIDGFDGAPLLRVGRTIEPTNGWGWSTAAEVARVEAVMLGPLADSGMRFRKVDGHPIGDDNAPLVAQFGFIGFPHAVFGAGHGPLRVRCVEAGTRQSSPRQE